MWILLVAVGIFVIFYIANTQSFTVWFLAIAITFWQAFIYLYTALKNPGIATPINPDDPEFDQYEDDPDFCSTCKVMKVEDTYHCEDCEVCIKGYDHHCPWTGKCIGEGNLLPFYIFLCSTVVYLVFFILITVNAV